MVLSLIKYILLFALSSAVLFAQTKSYSNIVEPKKLLEVLELSRTLRSPLPLIEYYGSDGKCGFQIRAHLHRIAKEQLPDTRLAFKILLQPYQMHQYVERGRFRIHFDTTGFNEPALIDGNNNRIPNSYMQYVDSVGAVFNHVWYATVSRAGFVAPSPVEELYNIYIVEYNGTLYGETFFEEELSTTEPIRYRTSIQIDNDFSEHKSKGMRGLKVTAAHEFHHAVQLSSYGYWDDNELYAHELSSTWMETYIYPEIKDYYQYLPRYFSNFGVRGLSLNTTEYTGYERVIWALFLSKKFGVPSLVKVWEQMRVNRFIEANDVVLRTYYGTMLAEEYNEFAYWNYYTSYRADTSRSYSEAYAYPLFQASATGYFTGSMTKVQTTVSPLAITMFRVVTAKDTISIIIANTDIENAKASSTSRYNVGVTVSSSHQPNALQLDNNLFAVLDVADNSLWRYTFIIDGISTTEKPGAVSPQPLLLQQNLPLVLPLGVQQQRFIEIGIYTITGRKVFSTTTSVTFRNGKFVVLIPVEVLRGRLNSGVYLVMGESENKRYIWKVAVVQ